MKFQEEIKKKKKTLRLKMSEGNTYIMGYGFLSRSREKDKGQRANLSQRILEQHNHEFQPP